MAQISSLIQTLLSVLEYESHQFSRRSGSRTIPPVGNCTRPRRIHSFYKKYYNSLQSQFQGLFSALTMFPSFHSISISWFPRILSPHTYPFSIWMESPANTGFPISFDSVNCRNWRSCSAACSPSPRRAYIPIFHALLQGVLLFPLLSRAFLAAAASCGDASGVTSFPG